MHGVVNYREAYDAKLVRVYLAYFRLLAPPAPKKINHNPKNYFIPNTRIRLGAIAQNRRGGPSRIWIKVWGYQPCAVDYDYFQQMLNELQSGAGSKLFRN